MEPDKKSEAKPSNEVKNRLWVNLTALATVIGILVTALYYFQLMRTENIQSGKEIGRNEEKIRRLEEKLNSLEEPAVPGKQEGNKGASPKNKTFSPNPTQLHSPSELNTVYITFDKELDEYQKKYEYYLNLYNQELENNKDIRNKIGQLEVDLDVSRKLFKQLIEEKSPIIINEIIKRLQESFEKMDQACNELEPSKWNDIQPVRPDTIRITTIVKVADEEKRGDDAIETARNHTAILKHDSDSNLFKRFKKKTKKEIVEQTLQEYNNALNFYKSAGAQSKIRSTENEIKKFILDFSKYLNK